MKISDQTTTVMVMNMNIRRGNPPRILTLEWQPQEAKFPNLLERVIYVLDAALYENFISQVSLSNRVTITTAPRKFKQYIVTCLTDFTTIEGKGVGRVSLNKQLNAAAKTGDFETVCSLVASGVNPNEPLVCSNQMSPLMHAAKAGDCKTVKYLLSVGSNPNARGYYGIYALVLAAANGHADVVETLLTYGAEINPCDPFDNYTGPRALIVAAQKGHKEVVGLLVNAGADINVGLRFAAQGGHCDLMRRLIQQGADIDAVGNCYEASASYGGNGTFTIGGGVKESTAFSLAFSNGRLDAIRILIDLGAILPELPIMTGRYSSKEAWNIELYLNNLGEVTVEYEDRLESSVM